MALKKSRSSTVIRIDFSGVSSEGGSVLLPEGLIKLEIAEITQEEGEDSGQPYLKFKFKVAEGKYEGKAAYDNFSLQSQALWKLKKLLETLGVEVPDSAFDFDSEEIQGLIVTADIAHKDYRGRPQSYIVDYLADEKEEEPEKKPTVRRKAATTNGRDENGEFKLKQKVTFKEGRKTIQGVVTGIDGDQLTVKVGSDEYEMAASDASPA